MTDPNTDAEAEAVLALEPEDLDGHTIDELDDYLERDRQPADASIDNSPSCQIALAALQRLHDIAGDYLNRNDAPTGTDEDWIAAVLASLPLDTRPGRHYPYDTNDPHLQAYVTEAAIRGLIRATGDSVPGLLIGRADLRNSDATGSVVDLALEAVLLLGTPLATAGRDLRAALQRVLPDHVPFTVRQIDIHIVDLVIPPTNQPDIR